MIKNKNYINIYSKAIGNERRNEMYHEVVDRGTFLPKTVLYEDIDRTFKEWVNDDITIISDEGTEFPTMTLYSSQRFSEYAQTWEYVDSNNNLLLNFKTVSRDNNPQKGEFNGNVYNIPGDRYYTIREGKVLDDNGSESILRTRMKLPTPVNLLYRVSVFTNKYDKLNEFNTIINKKFASRQCYIAPNGHYMPMLIDSIDDKSEYNIEDRQFYGQTITVKVLGYIITEDDYIVEEVPYKLGGKFLNANHRRKKAIVEIEDDELKIGKNNCWKCSDSDIRFLFNCPCGEENNEGTSDNKYNIEDNCGEVIEEQYYYKPIKLTIKYPKCITLSEFTIDTDFIVDDYESENIRANFVVYVNGESILFEKGVKFNEGDRIKMKIKAFMPNEVASLIIYGHNENEAYDANKDNMESELDENIVDEYEY